MVTFGVSFCRIEVFCVVERRRIYLFLKRVTVRLHDVADQIGIVLGKLRGLVQHFADAISLNHFALLAELGVVEHAVGFHANGDALLEAAVLAFAPILRSDRALLAIRTGELALRLHRSARLFECGTFQSIL